MLRQPVCDAGLQCQLVVGGQPRHFRDIFRRERIDLCPWRLAIGQHGQRGGHRCRGFWKDVFALEEQRVKQ